MDRPNNVRYEDAIFVENVLFNFLVPLKCIQLHYIEILPKELIRHRFSKVEFSKSKQKESTERQKIGTKRLSEVWNKFVANKTTNFFLIVVLKTILSRLLISSDMSSTLCSHLLNNESSKKDRINLKNLIA